MYCPHPSANGMAPVPPAASATTSGAPPNDDKEEAMVEEAVVSLVLHLEHDIKRCKLKLLTTSS